LPAQEPPPKSNICDIPLCRDHQQLHQAGNEVAWWHDLGINALEIAKGLWDQTRAKDGHANQQIQTTTVDAGETTTKN
jgi:hypothetical protein